VKGAFTGAIKQKRGRFERANEGTIFEELGIAFGRKRMSGS